VPRTRPTLRDVAHRAGLSHQTVSRVINNNERVSPETRAQVQAAIAELGYRPNAIARSMARGRSLTLACLAPNLTDYTFASIIEGAENEARQHDYFLLSSSVPDEASFAALIEQLVPHRRVDGLLIVNPYSDNRHRLLPENFPIVYIGAHPRTEAVDSVGLDDTDAGRQATQHLLSLGHRQIALISGPLSEDCSQDRCTGYATALHAAGLEPDPALQREGDWSATSGYQALMHWHQAGRLPTAVFAQNDRMALGVLRAARELNLAVPRQLAVIGIDDMPLASYFDPPLTTMRQDMFGIGREAVQLLIASIEQPWGPRRHPRLPAELVVRQSTAMA
jgi:DNA-binding LacI/PurR family transcriptional regulator